MSHTLKRRTLILKIVQFNIIFFVQKNRSFFDFRKTSETGRESLSKKSHVAIRQIISNRLHV